MAASVRNRKLAAIKAVVLAVFIVTAVAAVRFTPLRDYLAAEKLAILLEAAGLWAPFAYILCFTVGVCLFVPGVLLVGVGAAVFGASYGFLYGWLGALLGSSVAFLMGRYLGRDFAASLVTEKLRAYDDKIEQNGFATVLYLRLAWMPLSPMGFGMGLTKVRFRDYFLGTALGTVVAIFMIAFFVETVKEAWVNGSWGELLSWKTLLALLLLLFSLLVPKVLERFKARQRTQTS